MNGLPVSIKPDVDVRGITPECVLGVLLASQVFEAHGVPLVVTSVKDGAHGPKSKHYEGHAFDCRLASRYTGTTGTDRKLLGELKAAMDHQYDVVLEPDHFHVEFDP